MPARLADAVSTYMPQLFAGLLLRRGRLDFQAFFGALRDVDFDGWAIVELDRTVEPGQTPKESAVQARAYLEQTLGFPI